MAAFWLIREATSRRLEEAQKNASNLEAIHTQHAAALERIYAARVEEQREAAEALREVAKERREDMLWYREHLDGHILRGRDGKELG